MIACTGGSAGARKQRHFQSSNGGTSRTTPALAGAATQPIQPETAIARTLRKKTE
jgi:hypothetical protein